MEGLYYPPRNKKCTKCKIFTIIPIVLLVILLICAIITFVILPLVFMNNIGLQRTLMFTTFGLPTDKEYFEKFHLPGYKNRYINVKDLDGKRNVSIGLWHMLPTSLTYNELQTENFDFDNALKNSSYDVLLYMHGTGEARDDSIRKYQIFRHNFHVIAFDYRSYADSTRATLSEDAVVNDCVQVYKWLLEMTNSSIYVWGHSLGSALAARTVATLNNEGYEPSGLILESAFTNMKDEMYVHPYGKLFAWLPWFKQTIINPLQKNGFIFDTATNILNTTCPIMLLHAEDDSIVPVDFCYKLNNIALKRPNATVTTYIFKAKYNYDHYFIYQDPFFQYYIMFYMNKTNDLKPIAQNF